MKTLATASVLTLLAASCLVVKAADSQLNSDDASFVKKATQGGIAEVQLGRLAQEKATDPNVKDFGARMMKDHSAANQKLSALAGRKGVELPSGKGMGNDALYLKLKVLSGKQFDKAYVSAMVDDHKEDVAAFEKASTDCKDPDVRSFAAKTLPTLRSHLEMIQRIQASYKD